MFKIIKRHTTPCFKLFQDDMFIKNLNRNNIKIIDFKELRGFRRRALPFPPNFQESHQVFYPFLKTFLKEKNHLENSINLIDIGLQPTRPNFLEVKAQHKSKNEKKVTQNFSSFNVSSSHDVLNLLDFEDKMKEVNYEEIYQDWSRSNAGLQLIVDLACYYKIYENLFNDLTYKKIDKTVKVKFGDYFPRYEKTLNKEIKEYYPGGVRIEDPNPKPVKFFTPIAPMHVEFVAEEQSDSDEVEVTPVYRGNHIKPKFCKTRPNVVIDATLVTGRHKPKDCLSNLVEPGILLIGDSDSYYTLALFNLDSQFGDADPICHWMICNIKSESDVKPASYNEMISYLPPYGIQGLGYHRYVFLLVRQKNIIKQDKITDFILSKRQFNPLNFIQDKKSCSKPVGLSWFQCSWDDSCTHLFHHLLDMREPSYEWIQPPQSLTKQIKYPESAPFNIYLDLYRDQKEINKEVLLERLKTIHPFEYKNLLKPSKVPPSIHRIPRTVPSWYLSTIWKRRNKLGAFRYLRNSSAIIPLENNVDLDYPIWPHSSKLLKPMRYPYRVTNAKPRKESKWILPFKDHPTVRLEDEDIKSIREEEKKKDIELLEGMETKKGDSN